MYILEIQQMEIFGFSQNRNDFSKLSPIGYLSMMVYLKNDLSFPTCKQSMCDLF